MKTYVTYDPGKVIEGGYQYESSIKQDLGRFMQNSIGLPRLSWPPPSKQLGFDTEYDLEGQLLSIGIAGLRNAIARDITDKKGITQIKKKIRGAKHIAGHSVAGDIDYLVKLGLAKENWVRGIDIRDSFLLARMYDENRGRGAYGLEQLFLSEFNFAPWKAETEKLLKKTGNAADWSVEQRIERCRLDAWSTLLLANYLEQKVRV